MLKRERADCLFHYSNTRAISSWQEGPLHPHFFSPPVTITPLNTNGRSSSTIRGQWATVRCVAWLGESSELVIDTCCAGCINALAGRIEAGGRFV
ncbi:hypothetical protein J6590_043183 [Homalodisca vitripennis]|nr:hypothetical protein J6590_043183 [Homalodisca vitripennis]